MTVISRENSIKKGGAVEFYKFVKQFEQIIHHQVKENYPVNWSEDFITREILSDFKRNFDNIEIDNFHDEIISLDWSCFESRTSLEKYFGDIALVVRIMHRNRSTIEGATFIETKCRSENSIKFDSIKYPDISKITNHAPHSSLFLYDYEKIAEFSTIHRNLYYRNYPFYHLTPFTHCVHIPNNLVLGLKKKDTGLYNFSIPLSFQFTLRYFRGYDLDFSQKNMDVARGFAPEQKARFLVFLNIAYGLEIEDKSFEFNANEYREIKTS